MKVLVVCLQDWSMNAQFIDALTHAGFDAALLSKENFYINRNSKISRLFTLNETNDFMTGTLLETILEWEPSIVLPTDEVALRQMQRAASMADSGALQVRFDHAVSVLKRSLCDPVFFDTCIHKEKTLALGREFGWPVPRETDVDNAITLETFVKETGLPVVLKHQISFGGGGVKVVKDHNDLLSSYEELKKLDPAMPITVQQYIDGPLLNYSFGALNGEVFSEYTCYSDQTERHSTGHALMYSDPLENDALKAMGRKMASKMNYNGFGNLQFIEDRHTGLPYLIEMNPRKVPQTIFAPLIGIDFCSCLRHRLEDTACPKPDLHPSRITFFPAELLTDPQSDLLLTPAHTIPRDNLSVLLSIIEKEKMTEKPDIRGFFERISTSESANSSFLIALAYFQQADGDIQNALHSIQKALELTPDDPYALLTYSQLLQSRDQMDEACKVLKRLDDIPLNSQWPIERFYDHLIECNEPKKALSLLNAAIESKMESPHFYYEKAKLLTEEGNTALALEACAECLVRSSTHQQAWTLYNKLHIMVSGPRAFDGDSRLHIVSDDLNDLLDCCSFETPISMHLGGHPYHFTLFSGTILRFISIKRTVAETIDTAFEYCLKHKIGETFTIGKKTKRIPFEKQPFIRAFWEVVNPLISKNVILPIR